MVFEYHTIALEDIAEQATPFRVTWPHATDRLAAAIDAAGLINEPTLTASTSGPSQFTIICGHRRINACRQLGWQQIPARILPSHIPAIELAKLAIADNSSQRELSLVEMAQAVHLISLHVAETAELIKVSREIGLSLNPGLIDKLKKVQQMSDPLKQCLVDTTIALPVALSLHQMDEKDAQPLVALFHVLDMSLNRQRELLVWIEEICRRDDTTAAQLLALDDIAGLIEDSEQKDRRQTSQKLRQRLRSMRFPALTAVQKRFEKRVADLDLDKNLRILPPPFFESVQYSIRIDFDSPEQLIDHCRELIDLTRKKTFKSLFKSAFPIKSTNTP